MLLTQSAVMYLTHRFPRIYLLFPFETAQGVSDAEALPQSRSQGRGEPDGARASVRVSLVFGVRFGLCGGTFTARAGHGIRACRD